MLWTTSFSNLIWIWLFVIFIFSLWTAWGRPFSSLPDSWLELKLRLWKYFEWLFLSTVKWEIWEVQLNIRMFQLLPFTINTIICLSHTHTKSFSKFTLENLVFHFISLWSLPGVSHRVLRSCQLHSVPQEVISSPNTAPNPLTRVSVLEGGLWCLRAHLNNDSSEFSPNGCFYLGQNHTEDREIP